MRVTRRTLVEHRLAILEQAGRLFRRRGVASVAVADITRAAGLTHGAFYGHFPSKDALAAESCRHSLHVAAAGWRARADRAVARGDDPLAALIDTYLSPAHRDAPEGGCALAALGGGLIADRIGGPTAVAIAGVIGIACAVGYAGFRADAAGEPPRFSARDAVRALRERPVLGRVALAQGFYGGGVIAAVPLFALVHVDRLGLSLADVGILGILNAIATTVAFPLWGAVSDRFGTLVGMRIGGALGVMALIGYAVAPDVAVLWVASLLAGIAGAAIDVGIAAIVSDETTLASRAPAMAGWNAITGARGIVAAFLMSALVQAGVVDVRLGILLCAVSSTIGVVLFTRAKAGVPVETRAWEVRPVPART